MIEERLDEDEEGGNADDDDQPYQVIVSEIQVDEYDEEDLELKGDLEEENEEEAEEAEADVDEF